MSRIRSIHPGFWTDERFAALSDSATLFYIGLLTECDDQGVFEWKPLQLRMRLRPAKDGSVDRLLEELEANNVICRYAVGGRLYGAVRNFCKYQRPKFPKITHPTTSEVADFVSSTHIATVEADDEPPPIPRKAEEPSQMKEEAKEEVEGSLRSPRAAEIPIAKEKGQRDRAWFDQVEAECRNAAGLSDDPSPSLFDISPIVTLIAAGYDFARDILPVLRAAKAANKRGRTWRYYVAAITEAKSANRKIAPKSTPAETIPVWVSEDDPRWAGAAKAWSETRGKPPPVISGAHGNVGRGWHFPPEFVPNPSPA